MAGRLAGRVAFITGAGMGIGREAALLFAEEGAGVVVADIDANAAKETVALVERRGGRALATIGDVALEADVRRMVEDGARHFARLDVLYNNAGVLWKDRDRSVLETDETWWDRVIAINLKSAFWVTKYGIPELRRWLGDPDGLGLGARRLHTRPGRVHRRQGSAHRADQVAGDPVRKGPDPVQHHSSGDRGHAAPGSLPHRGAPRGVRDRDPPRSHRAAA